MPVDKIFDERWGIVAVLVLGCFGLAWAAKYFFLEMRKSDNARHDDAGLYRDSLERERAFNQALLEQHNADRMALQRSLARQEVIIETALQKLATSDNEKQDLRRRLEAANG